MSEKEEIMEMGRRITEIEELLANGDLPYWTQEELVNEKDSLEEAVAVMLFVPFKVGMH